jgi:tRNA (mo5U34)-methyltransferase
MAQKLRPLDVPKLLGEESLRQFGRELGTEESERLRVALDDTLRALKAHGGHQKFEEALSILGDESCPKEERLEAIRQLGPWKKGPHQLGDIYVDAEWDSTQKWQRVRDLGLHLEGKSALDVGAGNGFYLEQMLRQGARFVLGVEPSVIYLYQFLATQLAGPKANLAMLGQRVDALPREFPKFDVVFSMGVLYHVRSPIDHLSQLRQRLKPDGQLVLETITFAGTRDQVIVPRDRYANMRNVWFIPSTELLEVWLGRTGFRVIETSKLVPTTPAEQRTTPFALGPSLQEALDPTDAGRTVEGYPAPARQLIRAELKEI